MLFSFYSSVQIIPIHLSSCLPILSIAISNLLLRDSREFFISLIVLFNSRISFFYTFLSSFIFSIWYVITILSFNSLNMIFLVLRACLLYLLWGLSLLSPKSGFSQRQVFFFFSCLWIILFCFFKYVLQFFFCKLNISVNVLQPLSILILPPQKLLLLHWLVGDILGLIL